MFVNTIMNTPIAINTSTSPPESESAKVLLVFSELIMIAGTAQSMQSMIPTVKSIACVER